MENQGKETVEVRKGEETTGKGSREKSKTFPNDIKLELITHEQKSRGKAQVGMRKEALCQHGKEMRYMDSRVTQNKGAIAGTTEATINSSSRPGTVLKV